MGAKQKTKVYLLIASLQAVMVAFLMFWAGSSSTVSAAAGINSQLSFEGKIVKSDGTNITNGTYNMEFKIYQDGTNTGSGSTLKWTEDRLVGGSGGVTLTDGTFQVNLGSVNPFGSQVDWNQDTLWLSMQIGNSVSCTISTTFQTNCGGDGEMTPYIRLTAVPYANRAQSANTLGGTLTAANFVQLAQGLQTDSSSTNASIAINKTGGTANILQLQKASSDVAVIDNSGYWYLTPATQVVSSGTAAFNETYNTANATANGIIVSHYIQQTITANTVAANNSAFTVQVVDSGTVANKSIGLNVNDNGSTNASGYRIAINAGSGRGAAITALSGGGSTINYLCGTMSTNLPIGVCGGSSVGVSGTGVVGTSAGASAGTISDSAGNGVYGLSTGSAAASTFATGVKGITTNGGTNAYTSIGIYGQSKGGTAATTYGGYFTLDSASSSTVGAALYASNSSISENILQLQDNTADVMVVKDGGDIVLGNSTNGTNLIFGGTGNINATIRKNTTVTGAVNAHDVVMLDTTNAGQVVQVNTTSNVNLFGIATTTSASGPVAQDIVTSGIYQVNLASSSQAIAVGDDLLIKGSGAPGMVTAGAPCDSAYQMVGHALEAKTAGAGGTIWTQLSLGTGNLGKGSGPAACPVSTTLQSLYNSASSPQLTLLSGGLTLQDASSPVGTDLFTVQQNTSGGGAKYLEVSAANSGTVTVGGRLYTPNIDSVSGALTIGNNNATAINIGKTSSNIATTINGTALVKPTSGNDSTAAFQVQASTGTVLLNVDSTNSKVSVGGTGVATAWGGLTPATGTTLFYSNNSFGQLPGWTGTTWYYKVTALNNRGESIGSTEASIATSAFTKISSPTAPSVAINATAGNLNGSFLYKITYVTATGGETMGGTASGSVNPVNQQVNLTSIPTSSVSSVNTRRIYRSSDGGATYKLVTTLNDNTTTSYTDNIANGSLGANIPVSNTANTDTNDLRVTWNSVAGATSYNIYRGTSSNGENILIGNTTSTTFWEDAVVSTRSKSIPTLDTSGGLGISTTAAPAASLDVRGTTIIAADSTSLFQLQSSTGNTLLSGDSVNGKIAINGQSGSASWTTATYQNSEPTNHLGAVSVIYNNKIYIYGGNTGSTDLSGTGTTSLEIYNTFSGTWSTGASGGTASLKYRAAVVYNNKMYVWGGISSSGNSASNKLDIYDFQTNTWSAGTAGGTARGDAGAVVYNNKMYIIGGQTTDPFYGGSLATAVDIYDFAGNSWSTGTPATTGRAWPAVGLYNGKIYEWGGSNGVWNSGVVTYNTMDIYDIAGNSWSAGTAGGTGRQQETYATYNNKLYIWGGMTGYGSSSVNTMDIYDFAGNSWSAGTAGGTTRMSSVSSLLGNKMYIWGGITSNSTPTGMDIVNLDGGSSSLLQVNSAAGGAVLNVDALTGQVNASRVIINGTSYPSGLSLATGSNTSGSFTGAAGQTFYYRISAIDSSGETLASPEVSFSSNSFTPVGGPSSTPAVAINATAGNLNGTYQYIAVCYTAYGDTGYYTESASVSPVSQQVNLTSIPTCSSSYIIGRNIYRQKNSSGIYNLVTSIADNVTTTYTDNVADGSVGAAYGNANNARTPNNSITVNWTPVAGATSYRIYRGTSSGNETAYQTATSSPFTDTGATGTVSAIVTNDLRTALGIGTSVPTATLDVRGNVLFKNLTNSTTAFQVQNSTGGLLFNADTQNMRLGVGVVYSALSAPTLQSVVKGSSSGLLTVGAIYKYEVTAVDIYGGETVASNEVTSPAVDGTLESFAVTWAGSPGAYAYKIYRTAANGASGSEVYLTTVVATTYNDDGSMTPGAATPPSTATAVTSTNTSSAKTQVSIGGNGTPTGQLYVGGIAPTFVGKNTDSNGGPAGLYVQGSYAYTFRWMGSYYRLTVYDISNPLTPQYLGSNFDSNLTSVSNIVVQGKYAYIVSAGKLFIYNVGYPNSPSYVSQIGGNLDKIAIVGRYVYATSHSNNKLYIYDISSPTNPYLVGQNADSSLTWPVQIVVQGSYAYMSSGVGGTCKIAIYDVSNVANPILKGKTFDTNDAGCGSMVARGRYLYVANNDSPGKVLVYDISSPAFPAYVGANTDSNMHYASQISLQGNYVYVTDYLSGGSLTHLFVYDITNPSTPTFVAQNSDTNIQTATGAYVPLAVQGRYAYVVTSWPSNYLLTYDLGGEYTSQFQAGGAEVGTLRVDNSAQVAGNLGVEGGVNVSSSIQSAGSLGVGGSAFIQGSTVLAGGNNKLGPPSGSITVTPTCSSSCTFSYSYVVTSVNAYGGESSASATGSTAVGANPASNSISWSAVSGATSYKVYRTVATGTGNSATTGFISSTTSTSFIDSAISSDGTGVPTTDTTGQLTVIGSALVKSATNSTTAFQVQNASGTSLLNIDTSTTTVTFGSASNGLVLGAGTYEPALSGSARHQKNINLTAEYPGAVMTATSGNGHSGSMTSDFDITNFQNYYDWTSTTAGNDYDIFVRVPIPDDFSAWNGIGTVRVWGTAATTSATVAVYDSTNTSICTSSNLISAVATWQTSSSCDYTASGTWTAGGTLTLRLRLTATSANDHARVSNIKLPYYGKW